MLQLPSGCNTVAPTARCKFSAAHPCQPATTSDPCAVCCCTCCARWTRRACVHAVVHRAVGDALLKVVHVPGHAAPAVAVSVGCLGVHAAAVREEPGACNLAASLPSSSATCCCMYYAV